MALFDEMARETITIVRQDGTRIGPLKASLSRDIMRINQTDLDAEEGDHVERELPSDKIETYVIEEVTFTRGMHMLPDSWKLVVRKTTSQRPRRGASNTTVNITNSHGIQVGDFNQQHVQSVMESIIRTIDESDATEEEKTEAKSRLTDFLRHPLVTATLGGTAAAVIKAASGP